jgi:hypothetical protein
VQHRSAGEEACCLHLFFPYLRDLHVDRLEDCTDTFSILPMNP